MRTAELIKAQAEFEQPRGLDSYNTIYTGIQRMLDEAEEAQQEIFNTDGTSKDEVDYQAFSLEIIDTIIFAHSILGQVCSLTGTSAEEMEKLLESKLQRNQEKYDEAFFNNGWDTATAIRVARHWWNLGLHEEQLGNDIY